jgi:hypothetical protein
MKKKTREFNNILDECLERVLTKGETIEQCLAGYPEYAAELEPLLQTALEAKEATAIKPRPEFRERASYQFRSAIREAESRGSRGLFGWQPRWVTAVIVVIVLLLAGSGAVVASSDSLPDEVLYPVKLATEKVRLALTPSALGKTELYVRLADKRVDEIIKMAEKGKVVQVEEATDRLDEYLVAMASLAMPGEEELTEGEAATFEAAQPQMAAEEAPRAQVKETLPTPVPAPAPAEKAPRVQVREVPAPAPEAPGLPEGVGGEDKDTKQAKLREDLSHHAAETPEALREVLERAPESVKPALRRAIEVATAGYEQALRNLD